jgi:hypothetical protein
VAPVLAVAPAVSVAAVPAVAVAGAETVTVGSEATALTVTGADWPTLPRSSTA